MSNPCTKVLFEVEKTLYQNYQAPQKAHETHGSARAQSNSKPFVAQSFTNLGSGLRVFGIYETHNISVKFWVSNKIRCL